MIFGVLDTEDGRAADRQRHLPWRRLRNASGSASRSSWASRPVPLRVRVHLHARGVHGVHVLGPGRLAVLGRRWSLGIVVVAVLGVGDRAVHLPAARGPGRRHRAARGLRGVARHRHRRREHHPAALGSSSQNLLRARAGRVQLLEGHTSSTSTSGRRSSSAIVRRDPRAAAALHVARPLDQGHAGQPGARSDDRHHGAPDLPAVLLHRHVSPASPRSGTGSSSRSTRRWASSR